MDNDTAGNVMKLKACEGFKQRLKTEQLIPDHSLNQWGYNSHNGRSCQKLSYSLVGQSKQN
jgi:hypothetical protein